MPNASKSQADSLLYQLSNDWKEEYKEIAKRIAVASILYIDETGWKLPGIAEMGCRMFCPVRTNMGRIKRSGDREIS